MAALLVAMSIAAVLMTVAMPTWRQLSQREKEAELIFRGQQYARAIGLFQKKAGPGTLPPSVELLLEQRFLRKQYTDPVTGEDFHLLRQTQPTQGGAPPSGRGGSGSLSGSAGFSTGAGGSSSTPSSSAQGGIVGVVSKSKAESIRIYNGRTRYNEWQFVYLEQTQAPGPPGGGAGGRVGSQPQRGGQGPSGADGLSGSGGGRGRGSQFETPPFGRGDGPGAPGRGSGSPSAPFQSTPMFPGGPRR